MYCPEVDSVFKRVLRLSQSEVSDKVTDMDLDLKEVLLSPDEKTLITRATFQESQQEFEKTWSTDVKVNEEQSALW